jgi:hypothetical protein
MPFGLTNAPATFQAYMDEFTVYLNNILIYLEDPTQHEDHVRRILETLREYSLYSKAEKCEFSVKIGLYPHP